MTSQVNPVPDTCCGFTPYLIVKNAKNAIDFYCKALDAEKGIVLTMADGSVAHSEIVLGRHTLMLSEENESWGAVAPNKKNGMPITLTLYVSDLDASVKRALDAGMTEVKAIQTHFFGDRMGTYKDPYGYEWCFASRVEMVTQEEMQKRMDSLYP